MNTALLVIDAQQSFTQRPNWAHVSNPDLVANISALVDAARSGDEMVIWVFHIEPGTGNVFDPASGHIKPLAGLEPRRDEPTFQKTTYNAFTSTGLQRLLTAHQIGQLRICGIQTDRCCETTTRVAADLGYRVDFVTDATATFPLPHPDATPDRDWTAVIADPRTLPADAVVERTEYALAGTFATIRRTRDVVAA